MHIQSGGGSPDGLWSADRKVAAVARNAEELHWREDDDLNPLTSEAEGKKTKGCVHVDLENTEKKHWELDK